MEVFDVGARARRISAEAPENPSQTDFYYKGEGGSAHLHIFGKSVVCQLHIHEYTHEATIPVMGSPIVKQRFAVRGDIESKRARYPEGTLIVSPPNCAHEWTNPSATEGHASLVFTLGASFPGNLFVAANDERILKARPPTIVDAREERARLIDGSDRQRRIDVPVEAGAVSALFLKDSMDITTDPDTVTFVYTVAGSGRLEASPGPIPLAPTILVVVRRGPPLRVDANPSDPLALYVVRVPREKAR